MDPSIMYNTSTTHCPCRSTMMVQIGYDDGVRLDRLWSEDRIDHERSTDYPSFMIGPPSVLAILCCITLCIIAARTNLYLPSTVIQHVIGIASFTTCTAYCHHDRSIYRSHSPQSILALSNLIIMIDPILYPSQWMQCASQ